MAEHQTEHHGITRQSNLLRQILCVSVEHQMALSKQSNTAVRVGCWEFSGIPKKLQTKTLYSNLYLMH
jgi:hypothetical protein